MSTKTMHFVLGSRKPEINIHVDLLHCLIFKWQNLNLYMTKLT